MRLTVMFFFMSVWGALATSYSQIAKLSLNVENSTISQVIKEIEKQSEFTFVYNVNDINLNKRVSVKFKDRSINEVLEVLFNNNALGYRITDRHIALYVKDMVQQQASPKISGVISDVNGDPVIGANIFVVGTANGTVSDMNGRFEISAPVGATLKITYIGYLDKEVKVTSGKTAYDIVIVEDNQTLDEVIVVGYGSQKKSNITGAVVSVKPDEFKNKGMGVTDIISGRVSGVDVTRGRIIIRGQSSINDMNPLWIVDGMPGGAPDIEDIETIQILKDASSTAIYGAQAGAGVILVTTKKGTKGKLRVTARAEFGLTMPMGIPEMLNTADFIAGRRKYGFAEPSDGSWNHPESLPDTNWNDLLFNNAFGHGYYVQLTGGGDKTTYNMSGGYSHGEYIMMPSKNKNEGASFRIATETKFSDRFKFSQITSVSMNSDFEPGNKILQPRQVPTMAVYDPNNKEGGGWGAQPDGYQGGNPYASEASIQNDKKGYGGSVQLNFDWTIIDGLAFQAYFTGSYGSQAKNTNYDYWHLGPLTQESKLQKDFASEQNLRMFYTLTYDKTFWKKHNFKVMAGYEAYKWLRNSSGGFKMSFSVTNPKDISLGTGNMDITGKEEQSRSISQFARFNYAYDDKYMLEATVRRDGYDTFGPENRYAVFPSFSVGWNLHRESFIADNLPYVSLLKLRGGWGKIGSNNIAKFMYESSFVNDNLYYSWDDQSVTRGFWYKYMANRGIQCEKVAQGDVGLDIGLFNNRLNASVEYYNKRTTDMLYKIPVAYSVGVPDLNFSANLGEISNKGWDLMLQWRDNVRDFHYDVSLTLSQNKNKVEKLSNELNEQLWFNTGYADGNYLTENGSPMGQMYGYVVEKIFQDQSEIDALNAKAEGGYYQTAGTAPGDFMYKDLDGDGRITNEDRKIIGNPWPELIYGLNMNFSWKGFNLSMAWSGTSEFSINNQARTMYNTFNGDQNTSYDVFKAWTPDNRDAVNPRVTLDDPNGNFRKFSTYFVDDVRYFKLKKLHFGYSLPKTLLSKVGLSGAEVFFNGSNLLTITNFKGDDPEMGGYQLTRNNYSPIREPVTRNVTFGISLNL